MDKLIGVTDSVRALREAFPFIGEVDFLTDYQIVMLKMAPERQVQEDVESGRLYGKRMRGNPQVFIAPLSEVANWYYTHIHPFKKKPSR